MSNYIVVDCDRCVYNPNRHCSSCKHKKKLSTRYIPKREPNSKIKNSIIVPVKCPNKPKQHIVQHICLHCEPTPPPSSSN